jgi:aspartate/methionine/tyrosine aminotransferase
MRWAKVHPTPRFGLTRSDLHHCELGDLPGAREALALTGPNDDGYAPLVEAIAEHHGVGSDRVCTAAGASGANFLAIAALVRPGEGLLVETPGYDPLVGAGELLGAEVGRFERVFEDRWKLDPERVARGLTDNTRLVVVTDPHNPTGALATDEELLAVVDVAEKVGAHVLVDEVYREAVFDRPWRPAARLSDRIISTSSLTKAFGLSGLRCGWAVAEPRVCASMRRVRDVVDAVGAFPGERLSVVAFDHLPALRERARSILEPNSRMLAKFVDGHDVLEWVPPVGGAVAFPRIRGVEDTGDFARKLAGQYDTGIVPGAFFQCPAHFRVAIGGLTDMLGGAFEALGRALDDKAWE